MSFFNPQQRVLGWEPPKGEEHVEIPRPIPPPLITLTSQNSQSTNGTSQQSSPVDNDPSYPTSRASSHSPEGRFQFDQFSEPVRRGDPSWIARPRNPFIIFRCEYSRKHSKEGKRVRRPPGSQADTTLSKRAGEAWHQLSEEERHHFKELAEIERDEHTRMYPHYRFRPVKRGKKRTPKRTPVVSPPPAPALVVAPVPKYPPPPAKPELPPPLPPPPPPPPQLPVDMAAVKATRRRSASVPSLQYPFISSICIQQLGLGRADVKRARSAAGNRAEAPPPPPTPQEGLSLDPRSLEAPPAHGFLDERGYYYQVPPPEEQPPLSPQEEFVEDNYSPQEQQSPVEIMATRGGGWHEVPAEVNVQPDVAAWPPTLHNNPNLYNSRQDVGYLQPDSTDAIISGVNYLSFRQDEPWINIPNPPSTEFQFGLPTSNNFASYDSQFDLEGYGISADNNCGEGPPDLTFDQFFDLRYCPQQMH